MISLMRHCDAQETAIINTIIDLMKDITGLALSK